MLKIQSPLPGDSRVLLHSCCAPCSSAIVECMMANGLRPTVFYYNPNIYPREEYDIRKQEAIRFTTSLGLDFVDADYDHSAWLDDVQGLASSRWKSLDQINEAGRRAAALCPGTIFWEQNWRKGGLQERRNQLLRDYGFYNQQYCGCEYSMRRLEKTTQE